MTAARVTAVALALVALALPGAAAGQSTTPMPGSGSPPLTTAPGSKQQRSAATQAAQALPAGAAGSLPATGAQPLLLALAGASLLLVGAGLRLTAARG